MSGADDDLVCSCGARGRFSARVVVVVVKLRECARRVPLLPDEDYQFCLACRAAFRFVDKAVAASPKTTGQTWTDALIAFDDDMLVSLDSTLRESSPMPIALA